MRGNVIFPADILIPDVKDMIKWSVVACDQFTGEPDYWQRVDSFVGASPSALRLMLPEAWLARRGADSEIPAEMEKYLSTGVFRRVDGSYILVRRTLPDGAVRTGILGAVDLEQYDYRPAAKSLLRATEGTVEERLPPRVEIRRASPLEMPHIVIFYDDPDGAVLSCAESGSGESLYDFELMEGGGHISGTRICGGDADRLSEALALLETPEAMAGKYGADAAQGPPAFAMGDGNHSLAAAKLCWDELKLTLDPEERLTHPARFALAELVNIRDDSVVFEPIHRVLFDTDPSEFAAAAQAFFSAEGDAPARSLTWVCGGKHSDIALRGLTEGQIIGATDRFLAAYSDAHGGRVDYIHGDDVAASLASQPGCAGILLPVPDKSRLFSSIAASGVFPRKSFSVGHARDKRYYLECRIIKAD